MPSSLLFVSFVFCRRAIRTAFKNRKRAAILTTHYMEEAEELSDRIGVMRDGHLLAVGTAEELKGKTGEDKFENAFIKIVKGGAV